jgi:hypothetical protein
MIESQELLSAIVFGGTSVVLFIGLAGIRRIPWRHAAVMGVGFVTVFSALWIAMFRSDLPSLVMVGALGGILVQFGFDRGERERRRISEAITSGRAAPPV